jgi:RNA polymerase sigma-70 factor (ECF subfamily)
VVPEVDVAGRRKVIDAFLPAARGDDFDAVVALLDPTRRDSNRPRWRASGRFEGSRGARNCARRAMSYSEGVRFAEPVIINGAVGIVVAPNGRLSGVLTFAVTRGKIVQIDVIDDSACLRELDLAVRDD